MSERGLIFDLDGTLVDSLAGIAGSLNRSLGRHGFAHHPLSAVRGFIGNGARVLIERALPEGAAAGLAEVLEEAFKGDYQNAWPAGTLPYPGIPGLLEDLHSRGFRLAVLSNKPHDFTVEIVSRIFPTVRFDAVLGQRPGIPHKPDPGGALEIADRLGLPADGCIVIGDSTMDLETARAAGMRAIGVSWGYHDRGRLVAAGAPDIADSVDELAALLASA